MSRPRSIAGPDQHMTIGDVGTTKVPGKDSPLSTVWIQDRRSKTIETLYSEEQSTVRQFLRALVREFSNAGIRGRQLEGFAASITYREQAFHFCREYDRAIPSPTGIVPISVQRRDGDRASAGQGYLPHLVWCPGIEPYPHEAILYSRPPRALHAHR